MRRRTITLVIVGLVLALFVLPAAAETLLAEDTEAEEVEYELATEYDPGSHVAFYGIFEVDDDPDPEAPLPCVFEDGWIQDGEFAELDDDGNLVFLDSDGEEVDVLIPDDCTPVLIEGPNGQVNHGQYVSNMIHAVKGEHDKGMHGPFGQWVKGLAHFDGVENFKPDKGDDLEPLEAAELNDEGDEGEKDKSDKSNKRSDKSKGKNG